MGLNTTISVDVYKFDTSGNYFREKVLTGIPLPAIFVKAQSPDPRVYCYSKIVYEFPKGNVQQAYTAESVSSLITKSNA